MAKALHDNFGVVEGLMTTITPGDQMTLDGPHPKGDFRRALLLQTSYLTQLVLLKQSAVIPELNGKLDGAAQRVPVATGSLTELVTVLTKKLLLMK